MLRDIKGERFETEYFQSRRVSLKTEQNNNNMFSIVFLFSRVTQAKFRDLFSLNAFVYQSPFKIKVYPYSAYRWSSAAGLLIIRFY